MGYVHDTKFCQFIAPTQIAKTAGTWTTTLANDTVADVRTAADASFTLLIPILIPSNDDAYKGAMLNSIDVHYKITVGACDDIATVTLDKMSIASTGAVTGAAVTITVAADHDTGAKRKTVADHFMTVALNTPVWVDKDEVFWLSVVCDAAANTVFTLWGAKANFTLRA